MKKSIYVLLLSLLNIFCNTQNPNSDTSESLSELPVLKDSLITAVRTALVEYAPFEYFIHANGKLKSSQDQIITSEIAGKIIMSRAKNGMSTSPGSLLVQLDTIQTLYRLERANLLKFNTQREYESQLLGYENLIKSKNEKEANDIKQKLRISTGLAGAEQEIKEAKYELSKSKHLAPFQGLIADVKIQEGEIVRQGQDLFRVFNPNKLFLEAKILEADIARIRIGTHAEVSTISDLSVSFSAIVTEINPYIDDNGQATIKLSVSQRNDQPPIMIYPGMNCISTIHVSLSNTLVIPKEAVVIRNDKTVVFTLELGKAKWNYVTIGRENEKVVEIQKGLVKGQKAIISDNLQLAHDAPVVEIKTIEVKK